MDNRPIGILDSGLGGLTVLQEFLKELPQEDYIYFADRARVPYGSQPRETIITYARQIIRFLIQQDVKMIIIACGTISAVAYETLKQEFSIPIQIVIPSLAKRITDEKVGVIATETTIASHTWKTTLQQYHPDCQVYEKACPFFVPYIEATYSSHPYSQQELQSHLTTYLQDFIDWKVTGLVLGCTHYPLLEKEIRAFLPSSITIYSVAPALVEDTKQQLTRENALRFSRKQSECFAYTTR